MSTAVAKTIPIGAVQAYWNDIRLGSPMSQAALRYNKETVQAGLEEAGLNTISRKVKETAEVDIVIADFKLDQMRYCYDQAEGYDSASVILADAYKASTSVIFRFKERHVMSGTASVTLDRAGWTSGTIKVWKNDYTEEYTKGTDWTGDNTVGTVARLGGGSITNLASVWIDYNQSATSSKLGAGGQMSDFEADLRLVHNLEDGKTLQFYAYRAKKIGASDVAIQMAAEFSGEPMTFHILADLTQNVGSQLFYWALEA
jgi:hypothetical protein